MFRYIQVVLNTNKVKKMNLIFDRIVVIITIGGKRSTNFNEFYKQLNIINCFIYQCTAIQYAIVNKSQYFKDL